MIMNVGKLFNRIRHAVDDREKSDSSDITTFVENNEVSRKERE